MANHFLPGTVWIQFADSVVGLVGSEGEGDRTVVVVGELVALAVEAREGLAGLELGPGLRVVDDD